jgi:micrococcal nuclease
MLRPSIWSCGRTVRKPKPSSGATSSRCDPSYPTVCIPPYDQVGDLDCDDVQYTGFAVTGSDPHGFDGDADGVGCED